MKDQETKDLPPHPPASRICPFLSGADRLVECVREKCGIWMINECAIVRLAKGKTCL